MPDTECRSRKIAGDELVMVFGKDGVIGKGNGPFTPVRIGTCPVLSFTRGPEGLMVNGFGYDSDGNVVWRIEKNEFSLVLRGFLKGTRPDASTISIVDEKGRENLFIRYQNANAVQVRGTFRCSDMRPVTFGFNSVRVAGEPRASQCATVAPGTVPGITYTDPAP
ncbi:MAG: hypothetical protein EON48_16075 [Acetobacteraceae bacterium]|nr:MAG: hypothetical protein EON48_16075 [Acetobacteraceae bacterium]